MIQQKYNNMRRLSNIIIMAIMAIVMTILFSSCSKTNELDPCYVIEQEIERLEDLIDRMVELQMSPDTDDSIRNQLRIRLLETRGKVYRLNEERSEICG